MDHQPQPHPTEHDPVARLDPDQITALEALLAGETDAAAAEAADVHRTTVSRWKHHDPFFIAAFRIEKADRIGRARQRLTDQILGPAIEAVIDAAKEGDAHVAIQVLKGLGVLGTEPVEGGVTNPAVLQLEQEFQRQLLGQIDAFLQSLAAGGEEAEQATDALAPALEEAEGADPATRTLIELRDRVRAAQLPSEQDEASGPPEDPSAP